MAFADDPDRFAVAIVHCAAVFRGLPLYQAASVAVALTSTVALDATSVSGTVEALRQPQEQTFIKLSGGPPHATVKGATGALVAKVKAPRTQVETDWIKSSAAGLDALIDQYFTLRPALDASFRRTIFDYLAVLGWTPILSTIVAKLAAAAQSNFPPADRPPTRKTMDRLWPKPKS